MTVVALYPASALNNRRVDEQFSDEATAWTNKVALFDEHEDRIVYSDRIDQGDTVVYRGWMLTADQYDNLENHVSNLGAVMLTDRSSYIAAHHLPGWVDTMSALTPETVIFDKNEFSSLRAKVESKLGTGPFVVKDFVKSAKNHWDEACFAPDLESLEPVVSKFLEIQGEFLTGGVVVRKFENFVGPETRVWWVDGEEATRTPHPDNPNTEVLEEPLDEVAEIVAQLGLPFVTTDVVMDDSGNLRVVELGDGQVSEFPQKHSDKFVKLVQAIENLA